MKIILRNRYFRADKFTKEKDDCILNNHFSISKFLLNKSIWFDLSSFHNVVIALQGWIGISRGESDRYIKKKIDEALNRHTQTRISDVTFSSLNSLIGQWTEKKRRENKRKEKRRKGKETLARVQRARNERDRERGEPRNELPSEVTKSETYRPRWHLAVLPGARQRQPRD